MASLKNAEGNNNDKVIYLITGILIYLLLVLVCMHIGYQEGTSMKTADRDIFYYMQAGMESFSENPLGCFPFQTESLPYIGGMTVIFGIIILILWSDYEQNRHDRAGEEYGSAKWFKDYKMFEKNFTDPIGSKDVNGKRNIILADRLLFSLDGRATQLNINELVVGGSGTGKSRYKVKPNALQANTSYVITDPSAELLESLGKAFLMLGHDVKILNLVNMEQSNNYNPFDYIEKKDQSKKELDVTKTVDTLMANTTDPNAQKGDAFWDDSMKALYSAIMHLLIDFGKPEEQNFPTVLEYIRQGRIEEGEKGKTELEKKFDNAREKEKAEIESGIRKYKSKAFTNWDTFKLAGVKTAQSILISASVRINKFDNEAVARLTKTNYERPENNIHFETVGDRPTAIFAVIPTADISFNFITSMFYSQMFDHLYYKAENIYPKTYSIYDKYNFGIESLLPSYQAAQERLEELKKAEVRPYEKVERFVDKDMPSYFPVCKENKKSKKKKDKRQVAGRTMFQVYIPFEEKTKEEVTAMSYSERKEYLRKKAIGGEVIREFYSEEMAEDFIEELEEAQIKKGEKMLAWPVRFLLDEFANIGVLPLFSERLATMRKYLISCMIILQNLEQLKKNYKDSYSSIKGNCDITTFLGSSEIETTEEFAKLLGDTTNRTKNTSINKTTGKSYNQSARKLLDAAELTKMDNRYSIVRIRGLDPCYRKKYDYIKHPRYFLTGDADSNNKFDEDFIKIFFGGETVYSGPQIKAETITMTKPKGNEEQEKDAISEVGKYEDMEDFLFNEGFSSVSDFMDSIEIQQPLHFGDVEEIDGAVVRKRSEMLDAAQIDELTSIMADTYSEMQNNTETEEHFYKS